MFQTDPENRVSVFSKRFRRKYNYGLFFKLKLIENSTDKYQYRPYVTIHEKPLLMFYVKEYFYRSKSKYISATNIYSTNNNEENGGKVNISIFGNQEVVKSDTHVL